MVHSSQISNHPSSTSWPTDGAPPVESHNAAASLLLLARPHLKQLSHAMGDVPHVVCFAASDGRVLDVIAAPGQEQGVAEADAGLAWARPGSVLAPSALRAEGWHWVDETVHVRGEPAASLWLLARNADALPHTLARYSAALIGQQSQSRAQLHLAYYEVIGQVSRFTAHALGNPLAGLSLTLDLLSGQVTSDAQKRYLERGLRLMDRLSQFKENLGALGGSRYQLGEIHLPAVVTDVLQMHHLDDSYRTTVKIPPSVQDLRCHAGLLGNALAYLVRNAIDAMPQGGALGVEALQVDGAPRIIVWDQGPGMPASMVADLFRVPVSSKQHGGGLGLLLVAMIIEQIHGGTVRFTANEPTGCRFTIDLPRHCSMGM